MEGLRFNGLLNTEFYGYGFIDSSGEGLITKLNNGFMFTLRYEECLLPTDAVNKALEERLDRLEELRGERPTAKKEIQSIREGVIGEMAKIAFIRPKVVGCFYDETNKMLILNTDSAKLVRKVTTALLKVLGKLETKTIHLWDLTHGLTTRLC